MDLMAVDVVIHGDFVQFQAGARCDSCQSRDLKCALQESDDGCMACAGASRECIFTRSVTVSGPKALYSWPCFIAKEPSLLRLNASAAGAMPGQKPHPIIFNHRSGPTVRPLQTPAPSSARMSIVDLPSPAVQRTEDDPNRPESRPGPPAPAPAPDAHPQPLSAELEASPRDPSHRAISPDPDQSPPRRRGVDPPQRASLGESVLISLADQDRMRQIDRRNDHVRNWLEHGLSDHPQPGTPPSEPEPNGTSEQTASSGLGARGNDHSVQKSATGPTWPDAGVASGLGARENDHSVQKSATGPTWPGARVAPSPVLYDSSEDEHQRPETPPADIDTVMRERDDSLSQNAGLTLIDAYPWIEPLRFPSLPGTISQPSTSNAAMVRYLNCAHGVEAASEAASEGSQAAMAEAEIDLLSKHPGILSRLSLDHKPHLVRPATEPVFNSPAYAPSQSPSANRTIKPKPLVGDYSPGAEPYGTPSAPYSSYPYSPDLRRRETAPKPTPISTSTPRWASVNNSPGSKRMSRNRSLSSRASRSNLDDPSVTDTAVTSTMTFAPGELPLDIGDPSFESFRRRIRIAVPRIEDFLLQRLSKEQFQRYKSLVDLKLEHAKSRRMGRCPSGAHCTESFQFRHAQGTGDETAPQSNEDGSDAGYLVDPALFGPGIPIPPAKRLPAEFECPFCFQVKMFQKPSDWSKHVQEDVAPFICTFPNCPEPKSFKRKADWVRHENERHRQLEWWQCNKEGCSHICYRRDNFVQHLVREHKMAEPKPKAAKPPGSAPSGRGAERATSSKYSAEEQVIKMMDVCRRETSKNAAEEPCRFCGNRFNAFKKLTVHLARHMELISLPILELVSRFDKDSAVRPAPDTRVPVPEPNKLPVPRLNSPINVIVPADRGHSWHGERDAGPPDQYRSPSNGAALPLSGGPLSRSQTQVDKPFRCNVSGCLHDRGFATQNDLTRHMKGVHGIYSGSTDLRYFRCQGRDCNRESKVWPRLDNFRGHVARMHPDEDAESLIERSTFTANENFPGSDPPIDPVSEKDESERRDES